MCIGGSVEQARRGRGCVDGWRVEMNNIDDEIANLDPADTTASLSSLDVPAELDVDGNVDIREPTVVPPIPVGGHLRRIGVTARCLAQGTLRHRVRPTARTCGAD